MNKTARAPQLARAAQTGLRTITIPSPPRLSLRVLDLPRKHDTTVLLQSSRSEACVIRSDRFTKSIEIKVNVIYLYNNNYFEEKALTNRIDEFERIFFDKNSFLSGTESSK